MAKTKQKRTQVERSASSTEAILDAAVKLFARNGSQASMKAIGQEAGFSHGLVLARFGSKDGLIAEVSRRIHKHFRGEVDEAARSASGLTSIRAIVDVFFKWTELDSDESSAFMVLLAEAQKTDELLRKLYAKSDAGFRSLVETRLQEAADAGELLPGVDPEAMAIVVVGMLRGISLQARLNRANLDLAAAKAQVMVVLDSLTAG